MKSIIFFICFLSYFFDVYALDQSSYWGSCSPKEARLTQSFVVDTKTNEAFGLTLKRVSNNGDAIGGIVSYYQRAGGEMVAASQSRPEPIIGHQGLSIQYKDDDRYFWSSLNKIERKDAGAYSLRYQLKNNELINPELFRFFSDLKTSQPTSPAVSYDQKYLVVQIRRKDEYEIRVFDLKILDQEGDYSRAYISNFSIKITNEPGEPKALQALSSDGKHIYVLLGSFKVGENNKLEVFTIDGKYQKSIPLNYGEAKARSLDSGSHYEPEGLSWAWGVKGIELIVQVAVGDAGNRQCLLYRTGINAE